MEIKNLNLSYGIQYIFKDVNIVIPKNEKIGVVGVNGAGKTTLFKLMMGILTPDSGKIIYDKNERIDCLAQVINQDILDSNITTFEYLLSGRPIEKLNQQLKYQYSLLTNEDIDQNKIFNKINKIQEQLDYWDCYNAEALLYKIIYGVAISDDTLLKPLKELSGGTKSLVEFVRLLYSNPDILLLDEPTNHLDKNSKDYITNYLKNYNGTIFIISHDEKFLDEITTKTLFIDKRTKNMKLYDGNFSKAMKLQKEYEDNLKNEASKQQKEEDKLRNIINKYSNSSGKRKKMAQDREKKLKHLLANKIEDIDDNKKVSFEMKKNRDSAVIPIKIENISFKYNKTNKHNIINNLSVNIYKNEKFLIVGSNGVGKSTLLKLIIGKLKQDTGNIEIANKTDIAYYAQELEILNQNDTILENLRCSNYTDKQLRSILSKFLFNSDEVFKRVEVLSPGEKARVALAKISISGANLLLLDEPTNHLDPNTQKIIADVFKNYDGTMIVVSHNPDFVDNLGIKRMLMLPSGMIKNYDRKIVEKYNLENKRTNKW